MVGMRSVLGGDKVYGKSDRCLTCHDEVGYCGYCKDKEICMSIAKIKDNKRVAKYTLPTLGKRDFGLVTL